MTKLINNPDIVTYPIIAEHCNDEAGEYWVATSPMIEGLVTDGQTLNELILHAKDAIAGWVTDKENRVLHEDSDPATWELKSNQRIMWVSVDLNIWRQMTSKTVHRTISLPEYLNQFAKKEHINVSQLVTRQLEQMAATTE